MPPRAIVATVRHRSELEDRLMNKRLLIVPLAVAACAVLLQGCLAAAVVGTGVGVAGAAVRTTGAVAGAIIPGESGKQRKARLKREKKAAERAERAARKAERRREQQER